MASPHLLSGWLSQNQHAFRFEQGHFEWADNPVEVLADTYHFLRLDWNETLPASSTIWDHDHQILTDAEDFYAELSRQFECDDWAALSRLMTQEAPEGVTGAEWEAIPGCPQWLPSGNGNTRVPAGNGALYWLLRS